MKLNKSLKKIYDKELGFLRVDMLINSAGIVLVPIISERYYNGLIENGYPDWLIVFTLIACELFFLILTIVTYGKISQTKKLCKEFQKNLDAYSLSGHNIKSPSERIFRLLQIFVLSITRKWRAERRKAELDSKVSEMLCSQVPELLQKNDSLTEENSRYREQLIESSNANLALSQENSALQQEVDKNRMALNAAVASIIEDKKNKLPDNMKNLIPENQDAIATLNWLLKAEGNAPVEKPEVQIGRVIPVDTTQIKNEENLSPYEKMVGAFAQLFKK